MLLRSAIPLFCIGLSLAFLLPGTSWAGVVESAARAFQEKRFSEVVEQLSEKKLEPEEKLLLGRALLQMNQYTEANEAFQNLVSAIPQLRDLILYLQGEALGGMKQYQAAAKKYRAAAMTKNSLWIYRSWRRSADALREGGYFTSAAQEYKHLLKIFAQSAERPDLERALALCQMKLGKRKLAVTAFQTIWLRWPESRAALQAQKDLDRLRRDQVKIPNPPFNLRFSRIQRLEQAKRYQEALEELAVLRKNAASPERKRSLDWLQLSIFIKTRKPAEALTVLKRLTPNTKAKTLLPKKLRILMANCLAALGREEEGGKLFLMKSQMPQKKLARVQQEEMALAAKFWTDHGHYQEALKIYNQLGSLSPRAKKGLTLKLAWLAYRSGAYDVAIGTLDTWVHQKPKQKDFVLYWQARAHARAGRPLKAEELYSQLLKEHPTSYYGLLAKSRLVDMGKLKLKEVACSSEASDQNLDRDMYTEVLPLLQALTKRYGDLFPSLSRIQILWRLGMIDDARRELRLLAIDAAWIMERGRPRQYIQRPLVERLWRDGPVPKRRWGKNERRAYKEMVTFKRDLGAVLHRAEISQLGWVLSAPDPDPRRHRYPRAYPRLVMETAKRFSLDPNLIWAIMHTESTYRLDVISRVGATGLMQIMPHTALRIAEAMNLTNFQQSQLFEAETNLLFAGWYLRAISEKFNNQLGLIFAAYNGGPHNIARWLDMRGKSVDTDEFIEEISFSESRRYAKKVLRLLALYEQIYCKKTDRVVPNKLNISYKAEPDY